MRRSLIGRNVGGMVGAILLVGMVLLMPQVSAVTRFGASSGGNTDAGTLCHAEVWFMVVPIAMGVDIGDVVQIWFNYTYYDNRSFSLLNPVATHTFNLTTVHDSSSIYYQAQYLTQGGASGAVNAKNDVTITDDTISVATIDISWRASISLGACSDTETKTHSIALS